MIIKKKNFNLTPRCRGRWPFTVPEVCVSAVWLDEQRVAFALVHEWQVYALSGALETHGFMKLEESGIWADDHDTGAKRNLTEFFAYLQRLVGGVIDKSTQTAPTPEPTDHPHAGR